MNLDKMRHQSQRADPCPWWRRRYVLGWGQLTDEQVKRGQAFVQAQAGKPYAWPRLARQG